MKFKVDRNLPVAVGLQLQGQIEYAVAYGELAPGEQMPTVRDLAAELGISPVTVSGAYGELQKKKLLVSRPGLGTFVSDRVRTGPRGEATEANRLLDRLITVARNEGIDSAQLINMIQVRRMAERVGHVRILFVGLFREATAYYTARVRRVLGEHDEIEPVLFSDSGWPERARDFDLIITFAHIMLEVEAALPVPQRVESIGFIPSEDTRTRLALIEPMAQVGVIATYPEFVGVLRSSVERYAPHVEVTVATMLNSEDAADRLANCDVVVFATGSLTVLAELPNHIETFEYRHTPSPRDLRDVLVPIINEIRRDKAEVAASAREQEQT